MANNHIIKEGDGTTTSTFRSTDNSGVKIPHQVIAQQDGTPIGTGAGTSASALRVTLSSDGTFATAFGTQSDSAASSDTGTFSFVALFKRALQSLTTGNTNTAAVRDRLVPTLTFDRSIGAVVSRSVKASSGQVYSVSVQSLSSSVRYFQLFNSDSAPSSGATPFLMWTLFPDGGTGGGTLLLDTVFFGGSGITLSTGIAWGISSTALTYTAGSATDAIVVLGYT